MAGAGQVLVLSGRFDPTADLVVQELNRRQVPVFRTDIADFPLKLALEARLSSGVWAGTLCTDRRTLRLDEVRSVYYRRPTRPCFPLGMAPTARKTAETEARLGFGGLLAALPCRWLPPPGKAAEAEYKPLQLRVAAQCGLTVPDTAITNVPDAAHDFVRRRPDECAVYKPFAPVRGTVDGQSHAVYATRVDAAAASGPGVATTAHLFQAWVPKAHEVRLTAVGGELFAAEIHAGSDAAHVDWRSDYNNLTYRACEVPTGIAAAVHRMLHHLALPYGAFDFVVRPDGQWVFLELNPNGQYGFVEQATGLPITAAICDYLQGSDRPMTERIDAAGVLDDPERLIRARVELTRQIDRSGTVLSSRLAEAFLNTARHPYVPTFYRRDADTFVPWSAADLDTDAAAWLAFAYSDESLITEVDGVHAENAGPRPRRGLPTSSSTAPGLMADMLDALDLHLGNRVLEIGTGSGYNAALLSHVVGDANVTTVDATEHLVDTARRRLKGQGLNPTVVHGDGALGLPDNAPYDRLIATCSVPRIPQTWLDQCTPDAVLVVPLKGTLAGGSIARLTKHGGGGATGHLLHSPAAFMPMRTPTPSRTTASADVPGAVRAYERPSSLSPRVLDDWTFAFFAQLHLPPGTVRAFTVEEGLHTTVLIDPADGSTARIQELPGQADARIAIAGPRDIWAPVEEAHRRWLRWHRPRREWFGVRITADGQYIDFTAPDHTSHSWAL